VAGVPLPLGIFEQLPLPAGATTPMVVIGAPSVWPSLARLHVCLLRGSKSDSEGPVVGRVRWRLGQVLFGDVFMYVTNGVVDYGLSVALSSSLFGDVLGVVWDIFLPDGPVRQEGVGGVVERRQWLARAREGRAGRGGQPGRKVRSWGGRPGEPCGIDGCTDLFVRQPDAAGVCCRCYMRRVCRARDSIDGMDDGYTVRPT
jgi:hypothetical protein